MAAPAGSQGHRGGGIVLHVRLHRGTRSGSNAHSIDLLRSFAARYREGMRGFSHLLLRGGVCSKTLVRRAQPR